MANFPLLTDTIKLKFKAMFKSMPKKNIPMPLPISCPMLFLESARKKPRKNTKTGATKGPPKNSKKLPIVPVEICVAANSSMMCTWIIKTTAKPFSKSALCVLLFIRL